jgi:hypothetical protein
VRALAAIAIATTVGACSVPPLSLDGKQCPCVEAGFTCDTLTNQCLRTNDGGGIIDTPAATQCLGSPAGETELYRYAGTFDWQTQGGTWTGNATEIHQASATTQDTFAYRSAADLSAATNVRVIASLRQIMPGTGSPSLGIVLRAQLSDKPRYSCEWSAKDRELRIELHGTGSSTVLGTAPISPTATLPTSFTMEAAVDGATLSCCIRELADARLTDIADPNNTLPQGFPGLGTNRMDAASGSFVVFQRP